MNARRALVGLYGVVATFLAGVLVGDEARYKSPEYAKAIAVAVAWPLLPVARLVFETD